MTRECSKDRITNDNSKKLVFSADFQPLRETTLPSVVKNNEQIQRQSFCKRWESPKTKLLTHVTEGKLEEQLVSPTAQVFLLLIRDFTSMVWVHTLTCSRSTPQKPSLSYKPHHVPQVIYTILVFVWLTFKVFKGFTDRSTATSAIKQSHDLHKLEKHLKNANTMLGKCP